MTETGYYRPEDTGGEEQSTAGQVGERVQGAAQQVKGQARDTAQQVAGQAQEKAQQVKGQASDQVRRQVDERSTQAGEQVSSIAQALRRTGESLRGEGSEAPARVTDAVAERAERVGGYLRDSDADRILGDVEDLARRQPWLVAAGGFVLGLFGSRFVKASSARRYETRYRPLPARRMDVYADVAPPPVTTPDIDYGTSPVTGAGPAVGDVPPVVDEPGVRP